MKHLLEFLYPRTACWAGIIMMRAFSKDWASQLLSQTRLLSYGRLYMLNRSLKRSTTLHQTHQTYAYGSPGQTSSAMLLTSFNFFTMSSIPKELPSACEEKPH